VPVLTFRRSAPGRAVALLSPVERLVAHFKNWKIFHADYHRLYRTHREAFDAARGFTQSIGFE
jgi:hypothetical protein